MYLGSGSGSQYVSLCLLKGNERLQTICLYLGILAPASGANTSTDVSEQRDEHSQYQVQGYRLWLEVGYISEKVP